MNAKRALDVIALILVIVGAINWGLVGVFEFNLVTRIFGADMVARVVYALVGLAGLYAITLLARRID